MAKNEDQAPQPQPEHQIIEIKPNRFGLETPDTAISLFGALSSLPRAPFFERLRGRHHSITLEIATINQSIHFFADMPEQFLTFFESQLISHYPTIQIYPVKDFLPGFLSQPHISYGQIKLSSPFYYPIKTLSDFKDIDPLSSILGVMSKTKPEEGMLIQMTITAAPPTWQRIGRKVIDMGIPGAEKGTRSAHPQASLIQSKIDSNGLHIAIKVASFASDANTARSNLYNLGGAYGGFATGEGNSLVLRLPSYFSKKKFLESMHHRTIAFSPKNHILSDKELATIWHLPGEKLAGIKNIAWGKSQKGEPPQNLPIARSLTTEQKLDVAWIGRTDFKNQEEIFGIKKEDRFKHTYVIGKTGTGKSTLLQNMIISDMRNREGLCIIDPHGDFADVILDFVPSYRINDVVYLDPSDLEHPFHLNPFELGTVNASDLTGQRELVASGIVGIFKKLYSTSWGPRLEYILRNVILTLVQFKDATFLYVPEMLTNDRVRAAITSRIQDPVLRSFWEQEFAGMTDKLRTEAISPILNKVGQFISSQYTRSVISNPKSSISLEQIMDEKKILILNLSQGKIGEDNSALLGAIFITKMQIAAMNRAWLTKDDRTDFFLYVDEFQNFATGSFIKILSEARKYRLALIMANQYTSQLEESIRSSIFGNVGTLISFTVGAEDAPYLSREFGGIYTEQDLVGIDNHNIVCKLNIDNQTSLPFSAKTLPLPTQLKNKNKEKVLKVSWEKYGKK
ncbi:MAG: type IV secretion system DNA-binding domain-containing protein [bacterium]|nr:type IV secretion system DNA-binding domain-containing protein [bacterium]